MIKIVLVQARETTAARVDLGESSTVAFSFLALPLLLLELDVPFIVTCFGLDLQPRKIGG